MPAAAAIAPAVATVVGATLQNRSDERATRAQTDATNQALQFERDREERNRQERERARMDKQLQWDAYQNARMQMLRRLGVGPGRRATLGTIGGRPIGGRPQMPGGPKGPTTLGSMGRY